MSDFFSMSLEEKYRHLCDTPSDINDALPVLRQYASRCAKVTEFGIRTAVSTTALLAAQPERLISYDLQLNLQFLHDLERVKGRCNFTFHQGDTRLIDIEPTEMLFIDTCHQYGQLKAELERHTSKVSRYLALHDTTGYRFTDEGDSATEKKGLWPAIEEWLAREPFEMCYELPGGWGLTVFQRK
jgi:hypothetical protein